MAPSSDSAFEAILKPKPDNISSFSGRSDVLVRTAVPIGDDPRDFYLRQVRAGTSTIPPPVISHSKFVPSVLVEHLMRNKKDSAIGVKFVARNSPPDQITNMEGALHTFVTPIVLGFMHGDYRFAGGHGVTPFRDDEGYQCARTVLISAAIQPDFENKQVMLAVAALSESEVHGELLPDNFSILETPSKQDQLERTRYDNRLRRHMIANLTREKRLPDVYEVAQHILSQQQAEVFLEDRIVSPESRSDDLSVIFACLDNNYVVSLELLYNSYLHQLRNEISALETVSPQGYVYTVDPPAIFAQEISAALLSRLQILALEQLSAKSNFSCMKVFGFNDYADRKAVGLLRKALQRQDHIQVVPKSALFRGIGDTYDPLPGTEGCLLVIHNNSDAFGQNIESEWSSGSLDGAIGANSSAAAALFRTRPDLLESRMT